MLTCTLRGWGGGRERTADARTIEFAAFLDRNEKRADVFFGVGHGALDITGTHVKYHGGGMQAPLLVAHFKGRAGQCPHIAVARCIHDSSGEDDLAAALVLDHDALDRAIGNQGFDHVGMKQQLNARFIHHAVQHDLEDLVVHLKPVALFHAATDGLDALHDFVRQPANQYLVGCIGPAGVGA